MLMNKLPFMCLQLHEMSHNLFITYFFTASVKLKLLLYKLPKKNQNNNSVAF